jgi:hypothetical protein
MAKGKLPNNDPKFKATMKEFGKGELHSGSADGPRITDPKQAVAVAANVARKERGKRASGRRRT